MSTTIRPELSQKSKYWIPRERYYELKHFCLQIPDFRKELKRSNYGVKSASFHTIEDNGEYERIVEECSIAREKAIFNIKLVESVAKQTDEFFSYYILKAACENQSCAYLILKGMPCGKDKFYELYRRFFWLLDKAKG